MRHSSLTNPKAFVTLDTLPGRSASGANAPPVHGLKSRRRIAAGTPATLLPVAVTVAAATAVVLPGVIAESALPWQMSILLAIFLCLFLPKSIPDHIAALVLLFGAGAVLQIPPEIVFSGFHSGAAWIILAGFVIGAGIAETGLGDRIARWVLGRTSGSYTSAVYGMFLGATLLVFLLPTAAGRVMLLVPIAVAVARRMGFDEDHPGSTGIVLAATIGAIIPAYAVLPASLPNVVMLGTAQALFEVNLSYAQYFVASFPALAMPTLIGTPYLIVRMFPASRVAATTERSETDVNGGASRMAWILSAAIVFWASDFLHGLHPVWVALGAAVVCMTPRIGTIRNTPFDKCVHIGPWLLIASVVSLAGMIDYSGLGHLAGTELIRTLGLRPESDAMNFAKVVGMASAVGVLTTTIASPAIITSLAGSIAQGTGWPVETALFAQIPAWFFILLPHQTPVIVIALTAGGVPVRAVVRFLLILAAFGLLGVTPLYFLWLRMLGYFG